MNEKPKEGALRVWHIPQIPMKPFHVHVKDVEQAKFTIVVLSDYDLFQLKNRIKPDYSSTSGLEVWHGGEGWSEWEDENGDPILEVMRWDEEQQAVQKAWDREKKA